MVSGMTLGIVVDDTVHFLSKYRRAILVTSLILVAGFGVLAQSAFAMNSLMALLTAIAIAMAVVADFLLLPALLIRFDGKRAPQPAIVPAPAIPGDAVAVTS
jgi:predicted RND superfamily exporter protein